MGPHKSPGPNIGHDIAAGWSAASVLPQMPFERILPGKAGAASMIRTNMVVPLVVARIVLAPIVPGLAAIAAQAEAARPLSCTGMMIEPTAVEQSSKTVQLSLGPKGKVAVDLGQGNVDARLVSDNKIQLKFSTKDFTG